MVLSVSGCAGVWLPCSSDLSTSPVISRPLRFSWLPWEPGMAGWAPWPLPFPALSSKPAGMFWIYFVYLLFSKYLKYTSGPPESPHPEAHTLYSSPGQGGENHLFPLQTFFRVRSAPSDHSLCTETVQNFLCRNVIPNDNHRIPPRYLWGGDWTTMLGTIPEFQEKGLF